MEGQKKRSWQQLIDRLGIGIIVVLAVWTGILVVERYTKSSASKQPFGFVSEAVTGITGEENGELVSREGLKISKRKDGTLVYKIESKLRSSTTPTEIATNITVVDGQNVWINFRNEQLVSIMHKISELYDIEVVYDDVQVAKMAFSGTLNMSQSLKISEVLQAFDGAEGVKFKIAGRNIRVINNSNHKVDSIQNELIGERPVRSASAFLTIFNFG